MNAQLSDLDRMLAARASLGQMASLFSLGVEPAPPLSPLGRRDLRRKLFAERPKQSIARMYKAAKAAMGQYGWRGCLRASSLIFRDKTIGADGLPDPALALAAPDGLCGVADDLSVGIVLEAYARGLFASAYLGPVKWWSPAMRAIAAPSALVDVLTGVCDGMDRAEVAFDRNFDGALCDENIDPLPSQLKWTFAQVFDAGFAHSFDVYASNGARIGGGFGLVVGRVFVIEAMYFQNRAAMERGLLTLAQNLHRRHFEWIDAKNPTPDLAACGFSAIARDDYIARLKSAQGHEKIGRWTQPVDFSRAA